MNDTTVTKPNELEIRVERIFDAPRAHVFSVWTDPKLIPEWWGEGTVVEQMDVRPGGKWRFDTGHGVVEGEFREVEPLQPRADALEGVRRKHAPADAADLGRRHELRLLEQPDVLLHPGQRHAEGLGELADRRAARAEPFEDGAAGRVGEGREGVVDGVRILNH